MLFESHGLPPVGENSLMMKLDSDQISVKTPYVQLIWPNFSKCEAASNNNCTVVCMGQGYEAFRFINMMLFYQLVIGAQMLLNTNWNTAIKKYYIEYLYNI